MDVLCNIQGYYELFLAVGGKIPILVKKSNTLLVFADDMWLVISIILTALNDVKNFIQYLEVPIDGGKPKSTPFKLAHQ